MSGSNAWAMIATGVALVIVGLIMMYMKRGKRK